MKYGRTRSLTCVGILGMLATGQSAFGGPVPDLEAALTGFPTTDALREQVRTARAHDPKSFLAAQGDFDLAIRSVLTLEPPKHPGYVRPRVESELVLKGMGWASYPTMRQRIADLDEREGWGAVADFYRQHIDEFCVTDASELRVAIVDALVGEWSDWSAWDTDVLRKYRVQYPELHRAYALQMLEDIRTRWGFGRPDWDKGPDVTGPAMNIFVDSSQPHYVRRAARGYVQFTVDSPAVLAVLFDAAAGAGDAREQAFLAGSLPTISGRIDPYVRRAFWAERLDRARGWLRPMAIRELGEAVNAIRTHTKGADRSSDVVARLRAIADSDPDERVRAEAERTLRFYRLETDEPEEVRQRTIRERLQSEGRAMWQSSQTPTSAPANAEEP
ncbi:MAG: hypothetical protein JSV19_11400 [Phycisphaerales bacterium]|nr:MAG: hypothetical protein JSV19_11400 [Phycisphaerales bacterium]